MSIRTTTAGGVIGALGVTSGGTGTATAFTQGSVVFAGAAGVYSQNNANFFWDGTNHALAITTVTGGGSERTGLTLTNAGGGLSDNVAIALRPAGGFGTITLPSKVVGTVSSGTNNTGIKLVTNSNGAAFDAVAVDPQGNTTIPGGLVGPTAAAGAGRGFIVQLGKATGVNLNAVAATTLFTTPASGITRCVVTEIVVENFSGTPTTNAVSFGASATPTDYLAAVVLAGTGGTNKVIFLFPASNVGVATYGTTISFVANVTVGGAAITADISAYGYYR